MNFTEDNMASYDHYEKYEWLGIFWTPDRSIQFPGKLTYSPEDGIELEFLYEMTGNKVDRTNHIYGTLSDGKLCTLYGNFSPEGFGLHLGKSAIHNGKIRFLAALFGENSPPEEKHDGAWIDLTNFQEFCHPQGFKDYAKFSLEPIQEKTAQDLTISIVNGGKFRFLSNNWGNLFHCDNQEITSEILDFFEGIKNKHPKEIISVRNDIDWNLKIHSKNGITLNELLDKQVYPLENLLSLLVYQPIKRKEISIMKKSEISPGKFESLPLLTSLFDIDKFKISVLQRKISNLDLPISAKNSNIPELFAKWKEIEDGAQLFTGIISNRFGRSYQHQLYAEIILNLTQLEEISYSLGAKAREKYTRGLNKHAGKNIVNLLKAYLSTTDDENLGKALSDLRAEIAHIGKPAKHLKSLSVGALVGISRCIEIAIASNIYEQLGLSENQISSFQKRQIRSLPSITTKQPSS